MKKYLPFLFLFLIGITGYVDEFGSVDEIASHWLYLSLISLLSVVYYIYFKTSIIEIFQKSFLAKIFLFFILIALLSSFFAINPTESFVTIPRWGSLFLIMLFLITLFKDSKISFFNISVVITLFTVYEVINSIHQYFTIVQLRDFTFESTQYLKGVTGNKNITASSILIKTPFVFYVYQKLKSNYLKLIVAAIIAFSTYNILLLSSRAMIIGLILLLIIITIKSFYTLTGKINQKLKPLLFDLMPFISAIIIFVSLYSADEKFSIGNRIASVNTADESTSNRLRFYQHGINHFLTNPLIGTGLGNWKIRSIDYDSQNIKSYIVPYHLHNDFLEIACELGLLGLIAYMLFFLGPLKNIFFNLKRKVNVSISFTLLMCGVIYFIDSNLNFPMHRPISIVFFIFIISLTEYISLEHET